ncbi:hypothetical protein LFZ31_27805 [Salmonella enterica subsp. enterica serovar Newport str. S09097]|nr:hypothetical protein LFZ31_27805 [Salmonella enterica subsp. enterica serovar Newport str. S09097]
MPICTRLTAQIVKVAVNQPVAIRSSMWVKNNQNIHFMNLHVKKLEKLLPVFRGVELTKACHRSRKYSHLGGGIFHKIPVKIGVCYFFCFTTDTIQQT